MKMFFRITLLLFTSLLFLNASEWLYYKHYPWVYDHASKDWLYLRGSGNGKVYAYRTSSKVWEEFSVTASSQLFDVSNPSSNLAIDFNSSVNLEMIWCQPGTFTMGSPLNEVGRDEDETLHQVTLTKGFYLGKYEVTQSQYESIMKNNTEGLNAKPSYWSNKPNRPVEQVSWDDIQVFLNLINLAQSKNLPTGWQYALPTEAQWEYACRAGTNGAYSWGYDAITLFNANYNWSGNPLDGVDQKQTQDIGTYYDPNPWGFFNMHGNVAEWTRDWWPGDKGPSSDAVTDPTGPLSGLGRVMRGGSWGLDGSELRSANRAINLPNTRNYGLGFRLSLQFL
jgi:formylglycine-generating enzyme required for sulfatase activity